MALLLLMLLLSQLAIAQSMPEQIQQLENALTQTSDEEKQAEIHAKLGVLYWKYASQSSQAAALLEKAIEHYQKALQVYSESQFPQDWARIQGNLEAAYLNRIKGIKADNIEQAIQAYILALQVFTKSQFPQSWARIQMNLGAAYFHRIKGIKADNIEQAIQAYILALQVFTKSQFPQSWARIQMNLGAAYFHRIKGIKADNIEQAIQAHTLALRVFTESQFPQDWASTQMNLGSAYQDRINGIKADNIEQAIQAYTLTLRVFTESQFPESWAGAQMNLGNAYLDRIKGIKADNIEQALKCYQSASTILTLAAFPLDYIKLQQNLGILYFEQESWAKVCEIGKEAEQAVEQYLAICMSEESQVKALAMMQGLVAQHSMALAKLKDYQAAWTMQEKIKARFLSQSLWLRQIQHLPIDEKIKIEIERLRQEIVQFQDQLRQKPSLLGDSGPGTEQQHYLAILEQIKKLRQELDEKLDFAKTQFPIESVADWQPERIWQQTWEQKIAMVSVQVSDKGALLLVSCPKEDHIVPIWIPEFTEDKLIQWANEWREVLFRLYGDCLTYSLADRATFLQRVWHPFCEAQQKILAALGQEFWPKLDALLQQHGVERVLMIPSDVLYIFPLHATQFIPESSTQAIYPLERYTIAYTPSLRLYDQICHAPKPATPNKDVVFAEAPTGSGLDPYFIHQEALKAKIQEQNFTLTFLQGPQVTPNALLASISKAFVFHYYGDGSYDWQNPEKSCLHLANEQTLSLQQIKSSLENHPVFLVTLGASETGMVDMALEQRKQFVSLPGAFLQPGTQCVIASQWIVLREETCQLFNEFYGELFSSSPGMCPAKALRNAQLKLLRQEQAISQAGQRSTIPLQPPKYLQQTQAENTLPKTLVQEDASIESFMSTAKPPEPPKADIPITLLPGFWAPFYSIGNAFEEMPGK